MNEKEKEERLQRIKGNQINSPKSINLTKFICVINIIAKLLDYI